MAQRKRAAAQASINLTHRNAAGIDIGSASHSVAVPPERDDEPVREFARFTADLQRLADWLDACAVDTVAMESTGDFCGTQLAECDARIEAQLQALHVREDEPAKGKKRGRARNAPKFDLRTQLYQMCGVDLTRIDVTTALEVVSEVGADLNQFPSDKHFASWLGLCPGTRITGG